tara:strand:- start:281 stop:610 length:330 start_codon:yes stop_codon:yes gene_type:complete
MRGGAVSASSKDALVHVAGTENKATGEIDLHVDSKKSLKSKLSGGGRRHTRRRTSSASKKSRRRRGGSLLGTAILPFGLLWGQKSYQNSSSKKRSKSRRRRRSMRRRKA